MNALDVLEKLFDAVENILLCDSLQIPPSAEDYETLRAAYSAAEER